MMTALLAIALGYCLGRMHKPLSRSERDQRKAKAIVDKAMRHWHANRAAYNAGA